VPSSPSIRVLFALALAAPAAVPGCDNHRPLAPLRDGAAACEELSYYCAEPAATFGDPYQSCLETGDKGSGNECLNVYYACLEQCRPAFDLLSEGGAGGEGGAGAEGGAGGASGESNGGAGGAT